MKIKQILAVILSLALIFSLSACKISTDNAEGLNEQQTTDKADTFNEMPDIISLDKKMANYIDISLFDEENYSNVYLGKKFEFKINYNDKKINVPTTLNELKEIEFLIQEGSEYNENSYIFAKETISLKFADFNSSFTALFYNSSNKSKRLNSCNIAKIRLENSLNTRNIVHFNVNGIDNYSTVTDVITILGTPSHFYAVTEEDYYFDYFISKADRRNKIRVYVNLEDDFVSAVEISYYK